MDRNRYLPLYRVEGEGTGGAAAVTTTTTTPPVAASAAATEQPTLTQSQVNALLAEERRKATEKASGKFTDYDDLKAKAGRLDALEAENATTLEKERNKAKAEGGQEVLAKANARLIAAEVRAQAAAAKFRDPFDALAQLQARGQLGAIKVSDDGDVDGTAIGAALEQLAKDKAYLLETAAPPPTPTPGAAGAGAGSATGTARTVAPGVDRMRLAYETGSKK
jgi:hypothetical protein